jgi:hypothetical protein
MAPAAATKRTKDDEPNSDSGREPVAKKPKKQQQQYAYAVFVSEDGWFGAEFEGCVEEHKLNMAGVYTSKSEAENLCHRAEARSREQNISLSTNDDIPKPSGVIKWTYHKVALNKLDPDLVYQYNMPGQVRWEDEFFNQC